MITRKGRDVPLHDRPGRLRSEGDEGERRSALMQALTRYGGYLLESDRHPGVSRNEVFALAQLPIPFLIWSAGLQAESMGPLPVEAQDHPLEEPL